MRIYDDIGTYGVEKAISTLKRALTFVYIDDLLEPDVTYSWGRFSIVYKKYGINIGIELSFNELKHLNFTLEQLALDIKKKVISQYRYEIDKRY